MSNEPKTRRSTEQTRAVDVLHEFVKHVDARRLDGRLWLADVHGVVPGVTLSVDTIRTVAALLPPTPPTPWGSE